MLPRCATTSFLHTCIVNNIPVQEIRNQGYDNLYKPEKGGYHFHETITDLQNFFGYDYPIISVRRDKISTFVSLWNHTINTFLINNKKETHDKLIKLSWEDVLFFNENDYDLMDWFDVNRLSEDFCKRNEIHFDDFTKKTISTIFRPKEWFHRNNPNIIWFDIEQLNQLEDWISNRIDKEFRLVNINSSSNVKSGLIITSEFEKKYNKLYGERFEIHKKDKSLI